MLLSVLGLHSENFALCPGADFFCMSVKLNTRSWTSWNVQRQTFNFNATHEREQGPVQYILKHFGGGGHGQVNPTYEYIGLLPLECDCVMM